MRTKECIDPGWRFSLGDTPNARGAGYDDSAWRELDLPHDWSIEATPHPDNPAQAGGGFFPGGIGWYRKRIRVPADLGERRMRIEFDGVYMNSEVWCNGQFCGVRPYGYSSFCYDITPHVTADETAVIAVRVDNSRQKNSRWYSGSGIYRHVWLTLAGPVRVAHWGTYVTTPDVNAEAAVVEGRIEIANADAGGRLTIATAITNQNGKEVSSDEQELVAADVTGDRTEPAHAAMPNAGHRMATTSQTVRGPRLWSPDTPHLYTLHVELKRDGEVLDTHDTRFGIRSIRFDANDGFFLNGVSVKLKGVNEHHDAGCVGAAVPDDMICRRFRILKAMGCNAIRVAHNPASPAFLDLCDEMGFMVVEDAFDEWRDGKTPFGYQLYWDQWWERDLVDMIRRDRNHPCIAMWSVGNEIKEVRSGDPAGLPVMAALRDVCHREDPTRPMTCGCCNTRKTLASGYGPLMDVVGYNGGGGGCFDYPADHAAYPDMVMFASEVPHSLQTRGVYRTRTWYRDLARRGEFHWYPPRSHGRRRIDGDGAEPQFEPAPGIQDAIEVPSYTDEELFAGFDEHYQSSYDNALVRISSIDSWRITRELDYVCGEFRWTGFDYIGECYGWPCKSWNFGIIDLCGFPKDTYYFYQSQWTAEPMVHLLPHWSWPGLEGKTIPVICYTNCERVELFLNGESLGVQGRDDEAMYLRWDVAYVPGTLRAVGYGRLRRCARQSVEPGSRARQSVESGSRARQSVESGSCARQSVDGVRRPPSRLRASRSGGQAGDGGSDAAVAECVHATAGEPVAVDLRCEEATVPADRSGIAHVVVTVVDAAGRMVPSANVDVSVAIEGPARLIGLENGDPLDTTNYKLKHRRTFHGMMLAVIQMLEGGGEVTVRAGAPGLDGAHCDIPG